MVCPVPSNDVEQSNGYDAKGIVIYYPFWHSCQCIMHS
jgi:hypothetical protein